METIALNLRPPLLRDAHFSLQMTFNCCLDALSKKPCTSSTSATNNFTAASRTRTKRCAEAGEPSSSSAWAELTLLACPEDARPCSIKFPEPDLSTHWCKSSHTTSAQARRSTQGVTLDVYEEAKQLVQQKREESQQAKKTSTSSINNENEDKPVASRRTDAALERLPA